MSPSRDHQSCVEDVRVGRWAIHSVERTYIKFGLHLSKFTRRAFSGLFNNRSRSAPFTDGEIRLRDWLSWLSELGWGRSESYPFCPTVTPMIFPRYRGGGLLVVVRNETTRERRILIFKRFKDPAPKFSQCVFLQNTEKECLTESWFYSPK